MPKKNKVIFKTRRANNEGSIFQSKDGRWRGYVKKSFSSKTSTKEKRAR